ncbi:putative cytochrome b5-like heme/steroid binding domain, cytochrome b5, heme-binding protein [Helianthus annuus]|nr:putative cytochrome b5-like heme/steroid binding domain, cytochrome b5, heme-binding protein [Helianthus annuus]KAJ0926812.1 putative cytochrome b5-like heme/steroid binding domain, cytochrome b5, heme-binding protein [Helianthus annuus]
MQTSTTNLCAYLLGLYIDENKFYQVYNVTPFMESHPGGADTILAATRKDATTAFEEIGHSEEAKEMMGKYYVGKIDQSTLPSKHSNVESMANKIAPAPDLTPNPSPNPTSNLTSYKTKNHTSTISDPTQVFLVKILKFLVPFMILGLAYTALQ